MCKNDVDRVAAYNGDEIDNWMIKGLAWVQCSEADETDNLTANLCNPCNALNELEAISEALEIGSAMPKKS